MPAGKTALGDDTLPHGDVVETLLGRRLKDQIAEIVKDRIPAIEFDRLRRVVSRAVSIAVSAVVLYERWYGVALQRTENAERLRVFFSGNIDIVPFEEEDTIRRRRRAPSAGNSRNADWPL
jgi:hypothetical protein